MIPAVTTHGAPLAPCGPDAPCWVAGIGFRVVADTAQACAIDDAPIAAKVPPGWMITALTVDPWASLPGAVHGAMPVAVLSGRPGTVLVPPLDEVVRPCCIEAEPFVPTPAPPVAPVPIEAGTAVLLIAALMTLTVLRRGRR